MQDHESRVMKHESFWFMFQVSCFVLLDLVTKAIFFSRDFCINFIQHQSGAGFICIHGVQNKSLVGSISFGSLDSPILIAFSLGLLLLVILSKNKTWSIALILAGVIGNLIDRIVLGFVRDFIDISLNFTFNFADLWIVLGIVGLLWEGWNRGKRRGQSGETEEISS